MSARHPVPAEALDKHIAILGKTGSGKSNLAKTIAEDLLAQGARVCVIDPTGTWWGLRLMADGDTPSGHPIVIFGRSACCPPKMTIALSRGLPLNLIHRAWYPCS